MFYYTRRDVVLTYALQYDEDKQCSRRRDEKTVLQRHMSITTSAKLHIIIILCENQKMNNNCPGDEQ